MRNITFNCISILIAIILALSSVARLINHYIYQYPGNTFFPDNFLAIPFILLFLNIGLMILFEPNSMPRKAGKELVYFVIIMSIIAYASDAVQFTPFKPIDQYLYSFETLLHINMQEILLWTHQHPLLKLLLGLSYDSLMYQMSLIPIIVILLGRIQLIRDYYFLLLSTLLIGFIIYYFFPTTAPASIIDSPYFIPEQIATGLKFNQIHQHILPTTIEGGLIALPSFHAIWAILCVYLLKEWTIAWVLLAIVNTFLIASCVLLGWHYVIDIIAALLILGFCFYLLEKCKKNGNNVARISAA